MPNPILVCDQELAANYPPNLASQFYVLPLDCENGGRDFSVFNNEQDINHFADAIARFIKDNKLEAQATQVIVFHVHGNGGNIQLARNVLIHPTKLLKELKKRFPADKKFVFDVYACQVGERKTEQDRKDGKDNSENDFAIYKAARLAGSTIMLDAGHRKSIAMPLSNADYNPADVNFAAYKTVLAKTLNPQDTLKLMIYDGAGKLHDHKISGPKPKNAQDLSDENLRQFLLNQVEAFAAFYRKAKASPNASFAKFDEYITGIKKEIFEKKKDFFTDLRAKYCAIDIMHDQEKYLNLYKEMGVNFFELKYGQHSALKVALTNKNYDSMRKLMDLGCDPNKPEANGRRLMELAIINQDIDGVDALISNKRFDIKAVDAFSGSNFLMRLAFCKNPEFIQNAFERFALAVDINAVNLNQSTAAIMAAQNGNLVLLKKLIESGANLEKKNVVGVSVFSALEGSAKGEIEKFIADYKSKKAAAQKAEQDGVAKATQAKPSQYIIAKSPQEIEGIMKEKEVKDFKIISKKDGSSTVEIHQTKMNKPLRDALGLEAKQFEMSDKQEESVRKFLLDNLPSATVERSKQDSTRVRITFENNEQNRGLMTKVDKLLMQGREVKATSSEPLKARGPDRAATQNS